MNKKRKQMALLLGLLLLLLVFWYAVQSGNQRREEAQTAAIYAVDMEEVCTVSYEAEKKECTFEKQGESWIYIQDPDFPLAQSYPRQLAAVFGKLAVKRELQNGDTLEDYGLAEPAYTVRLIDAEGEQVELCIGNAAGEDYYMQNKNSGQIYTVGPEAVEALQATPEDMAQLDTWPGIGSGNLKKETILHSGKTTVYDSEEEEDAQNIAAVAGGLGAVSLSSVADYSVEEEAQKDFGLDEASRITVEVVYTEGDGEKNLTLFIGSKDGSGNRYMMIEDSRIVYLISEEICNNILNSGA